MVFGDGSGRAPYLLLAGHGLRVVDTRYGGNGRS